MVIGNVLGMGMPVAYYASILQAGVSAVIMGQVQNPNQRE